MNIKGKVGVVFSIGLILSFITTSCNNVKVSKNKNQANLHITSEAIQLKTGWGYKIEVNNHPFIYQSQIPCIPGDKPFPTKESAMAVARVVMNKIEHRQLPSISMAELKKVTHIKDN